MDRYCLVVPNGVLKNASDVFNLIDRDEGGSKTFSVKLSNDGGTTLTHWAAYTTLTPDAYSALKNMNNTQFRAYVNQLAVQKGRTPAGSITAFKASLQMSAANVGPWAFIASIGLVRWTDPNAPTI